jgi:hypothetical protein
MMVSWDCAYYGVKHWRVIDGEWAPDPSPETSHCEWKCPLTQSAIIRFLTKLKFKIKDWWKYKNKKRKKRKKDNGKLLGGTKWNRL